MQLFKHSVAAYALLLLMGCATTRIVSQDPVANIYMNDKYMGTGEAEVLSIGPPRSVQLEARREDDVVGKARMSRRFKFKTVLWGICSYYTGFVWAWYYPREVEIPATRTRNQLKRAENSWEEPEESVWMRPLGKRYLNPY